MPVRRIAIALVCLSIVPVVAAQDTPSTPNAVPVIPAAVTETPVVVESAETAVPTPTVENVTQPTVAPTVQPVQQTSPTEAPTLPPESVEATVVPPTDIPPVPALPGSDQTGQVLLPARNDIEILANNTIGTAIRPPGWNGTFDVNDPQMALKARLDLELLAQELVGARPAGWFGVQPTSAYATARDIRHDLELLADAVIAPNVRPPNWMGDNPIMRCSRATQAMALLLESRGLLTMPTSSPGSATFCADLETEVSVFAEVALLDGTILSQPERPAPDANSQVENPNEPVSIITPGALAFYDRSATRLAGAVPLNTSVVPVARSYSDFSRMTLVRGEGFEVFVDFQDTTLDTLTYEALGDINAISFSPACIVAWCVPPS